jgi:chromosomal replication initiation ATPase DnaA
VIRRAEIITGVSYKRMRTKTRDAIVVKAKRYTMKMLKDEKVGNLSFIGDLFDMDYSSVSIGIKVINELIDEGKVGYGRQDLDQ